MILVVGVSHHTAPIEVRETAALDGDDEQLILGKLAADPRVAELFLVSTCNRVELVAVPAGASADAVSACVSACRAVLLEKAPSLSPHLYAHVGTEGMRHLLEVASSLDSLVVGEPQILGQLKQGFERARERGTVGPTLHRAFAHAVRGAKRVRSETLIGSGQVSVPSIAVDLASQIFGSMRGHRVTLLGSGEMAEAVARLLVDSGALLTVVGRNAERVGRLAEQFAAEARLMEDLDDVLAMADVVVTSTSASEPLITRERVAALRRVRKGKRLFFVDLAVPRDVESEVGELDGVFLYNIDDLSGVVLESTETRRKEAERAQRIVAEAVVDFERWQNGEQATPVIKALRAKFRRALETELEKTVKGRLQHLGDEERQALGKMVDASLNRMLHVPTVFLREQASSPGGLDVEELSRVLSQAFGLDDAQGEDSGSAERAPTNEVESTPSVDEVRSR